MSDTSRSVIDESGEEITRIIFPTTSKYINKSYFFARWFPFHPYVWDEELKGKLVSSKKLLIWHLHVVLVVIFYSLLVCRCIQVTLIEPGRKIEQMYVLFLAAYYSPFIMLQLHAVIRRREMALVVNNFFLLTSRCEGNHLLGIFELFTLQSMLEFDFTKTLL